MTDFAENLRKARENKGLTLHTAKAGGFLLQ